MRSWVVGVRVGSRAAGVRGLGGGEGIWPQCAKGRFGRSARRAACRDGGTVVMTSRSHRLPTRRRCRSWFYAATLGPVVRARLQVRAGARAVALPAVVKTIQPLGRCRGGTLSFERYSPASAAPGRGAGAAARSGAGRSGAERGGAERSRAERVGAERGGAGRSGQGGAGRGGAGQGTTSVSQRRASCAPSCARRVQEAWPGRSHVDCRKSKWTQLTTFRSRLRSCRPVRQCAPSQWRPVAASILDAGATLREGGIHVTSRKVSK